jgi:hypothetical protein
LPAVSVSFLEGRLRIAGLSGLEFTAFCHSIALTSHLRPLARGARGAGYRSGRVQAIAYSWCDASALDSTKLELKRNR